MGLIPDELAAVLVCPLCHGGLEEDEPASVLICRDCGRSYPVIDGIPNMIVEASDRPPNR